jgi:hypothetical protein
MAGRLSRERGGFVVVTVSIVNPPFFSGKVAKYAVNHDDYVSRWRNTNYTREEALAQIL